MKKVIFLLSLVLLTSIGFAKGNNSFLKIDPPGRDTIKKDTSSIVNKWTKIDVEPSFPGGLGAWARYLKKFFDKHLDDLDWDGREGTCIVKFIVGIDGSVHNAEATTMRGSKLARLAVKAIEKGPKWVPATQNGKPVNAYRIQPITYSTRVE
jgi:hypothetical protein